MIKISLKFVLKAPIDPNPALGAKPLSEPMLTRLTDAYIRNTRGRWINFFKHNMQLVQ